MQDVASSLNLSFDVHSLALDILLLLTLLFVALVSTDILVTQTMS